MGQDLFLNNSSSMGGGGSGGTAPLALPHLWRVGEDLSVVEGLR